MSDQFDPREPQEPESDITTLLPLAGMRTKVARVMSPNPDYSPRVGVRKATTSVAANVVVSAAPATLLITILRYNGVNWWPESADPAATAVIMSGLVGIPRFLGDWYRCNVSEPRWQRQQAALARSQGE